MAIDDPIPPGFRPVPALDAELQAAVLLLAKNAGLDYASAARIAIGAVLRFAFDEAAKKLTTSTSSSTRVDEGGLNRTERRARAALRSIRGGKDDA